MWWKKFLPCRTTIEATAISYGRRLVHQQTLAAADGRIGNTSNSGQKGQEKSAAPVNTGESQISGLRVLFGHSDKCNRQFGSLPASAGVELYSGRWELRRLGFAEEKLGGVENEKKQIWKLNPRFGD
ncbi:hypothetical protein Ancab_009138 [Ancistrocladus abbreviatus]